MIKIEGRKSDKLVNKTMLALLVLSVGCINYALLIERSHQKVRPSPQANAQPFGKFLQATQVANAGKEVTTLDLLPKITLDSAQPTEDYGINLLPRTEQWLASRPKGRSAHEQIFARAVGKIYEASNRISEDEIKEFSLHFLDQEDSFDVYLDTFLQSVERTKDQRLRNFIYEFARHARPEHSLKRAVVEDFLDSRQSARQGSMAEESRLVEILIAQVDLTFEEKQQLLQDNGLQFPAE